MKCYNISQEDKSHIQMKINHIDLNSSSWVSYLYSKSKKSISDIYELRIFKHKEYAYYGYRYQLVCYKKERYFYIPILNTDSKEKMKMTLDLMGLKIKRVSIIIKGKSSHKKPIIPYSVIYLTKE